MSNVVFFPPRQPETVVWRCECGCITHFVRGDDQIECAKCGAVADGDSGSWRRNLPDVPVSAPETQDGDVKITDLNSPEAAFKRTLRKADPDKAFALIVVNRDGSLTVWGGDLETEAQRAWFDRKMAEAKALLTKE